MPTGYKLTDDQLAAAVAAYANEKTLDAAAKTIDAHGTAMIISLRLNRAEQSAHDWLFERRGVYGIRFPVLTKYGREWLNERLYFETSTGRWERFERGKGGSGDQRNDTTGDRPEGGRANAD